MATALFGAAALTFAALLALLGVLRTSQPPAHLADVEGLRALVNEIRADRDDQRVQVAAREQRIAALVVERDKIAAELVAAQMKLTEVIAELAAERALRGPEQGRRA